MIKHSWVSCVLIIASLWINCEFSFAEEKLAPLTVKQVIANFKEPADGGFDFNNRALVNSNLEVEERLYRSGVDERYSYKAEDKQALQQLLKNDKASVYARLCAASLLLAHDDAARDFLQPLLASKNLRTRYNAAYVLLRSLRDKTIKKWSTPLLIELVQNGALDGSGVTVSPSGDFPEGDGNDIMYSPLDQICWNLGFMKVQQAVPALNAVIKRVPATGGAAFALGEIGDPRGIPILLEQLKEKPSHDDREIIALGKMKAKEAVPELTARLQKIKSADSDDQYEAANLLEALLAIADEKTIPLIEECTGDGHSPRVQKTARRVLAQWKSKDKVADLLVLLDAEKDEYERACLIRALATLRDPRVTEALAKLAHTTDSSLLCHVAIQCLSELGDTASLLELTKLLDHRFPEKMETAFGTRGVTDFTKFFHEDTERCLEQATGQKLGRNRAAWETWIKENPPKTPAP